MEQQDWVKVHVMCGVKTNIVTAVELHGKNPPLVRQTARSFAIAELSADACHASKNNAETITSVGATPYIAFRSIDKDEGGWSKMYGYFIYRRDEFLAHYHKRSNFEATFSLMKRKFGDSLRSKSDTGMVNEACARSSRTISWCSFMRCTSLGLSRRSGMRRRGLRVHVDEPAAEPATSSVR